MVIAATHPWIDFKPNLKEAPISLWISLGQASSKCDYISGVPLKPSVAEILHELYLAKGVQATIAIEGNSLTEEQVKAILHHDLKLPSSQQYLAQEVENVLDACNDIVSSVAQCEDPQLSIGLIESFNYKILKDLPLGEEKISGKIRLGSVGVGRYLAPKAEYCYELLNRFCDWYNNFEKGLDLDKTSIAILKAILSHLYFVWIHPFDDGNGRTARLIELKTLLEAGLPMPVSHLLSNYYNFTRENYYRQLDYASKTGECLEFVKYAIQGFLEKLDEQIDLIRAQQLIIAWSDLVYDLFADKDTQSDIRRRNLVLEMSFHSDKPLLKNKITQATPKLAEMYATKTTKTLTRDLNELMKMNLVRKTPKGFVANKELILAFLPVTCADQD
ncbi:Fic family protein [Nodosilinea sp. FACHB-13]|uniref:Fic family protein n=1 Tax=Cyanophyceae TaxID=3028117 RepID=UPI00168583EC|nr:Fic family protein [Nodosilinea sp. FACHB-13]MBD2107405.1 Fic family protein [Nodosilinea sp. FACHB-13]